MIGSYEFRSGIDFVRVPGVVKQIETGEYDSANLRVGVEHTLEMRTRIIRDTADIYRPDLFIVDKEPLGLRGEVVPDAQAAEGARHAAGARPARRHGRSRPQLAEEWERKNVVPALRDLYDEIWVYGLPQINKPLTGIEVPPSVRHKMVYTGYLHRDLPLHSDVPHEIEEIDGPFILVTPGGGGDGADLVDWVLAAYETDPHIPYGAVIVFGPFMSADRARGLQGARREVPQHPHAHLHQQSRRADAARRRRGGDGRLQHVLRDPVLRQAGDHRAAHRPRLEQFIRARAARNLGLVEMLDAERGRDPHAMATALRQLPQQGLPSDVVVPGLLDGVGNVLRLVPSSWPSASRPRVARCAERGATRPASAAAPPARARS